MIYKIEVRSILIILLGFYCFSLAVQAKIISDSTKNVQLYVLEEIISDEGSEVNFRSYSKSTLERFFLKQGYKLNSSPFTPLKTNEILEHTIATNTGLIKGLTGYLYLQAGANHNLQIYNDDGVSALVETEIRSIQWSINKSEVFELAQEADLIVFANVEIKDISRQLNTDRYGGQKSINVSVELEIVNSKTGEIYGSLYDDVTSMAPTVSAGVRRSIEIVTEKIELNNN